MLAADPTRETYDEARAIASRCVAAGENLIAADLASAFRRLDPADAEFARLHALALARCGARQRARAILEQLVRDGHRDEETWGLLARTFKDEGLATGDRAALRKARDLYAEAFRRSGGTWSGINAACLDLALGEGPAAGEYASQVLALIDAPVPRADVQEAYWREATRAEALLVLGRMDESARAYQDAAALVPGHWAFFASSARNARVILGALGVDRGWIDRALPQPVVAVFTGHVLDAADRAAPRFPAQAEGEVAARLREWVKASGARIGYSSAANGADILFLEALHDAGAETNIVLPHPIEAFLRISVASDASSPWIERCRRALAAARKITVLSEHVGSELGYQFTGCVMAGLARLRSAEVNGVTRGLAVWDGRPGGVGGTALIVLDWLRAGLPVERIEVGAQGHRAIGETDFPPALAAQDTRRAGHNRIIAMLFGDAVGFSKLTEAQVHVFISEVLGSVRRLLDAGGHQPLVSETWGDGLHLDFASCAEAARFSLALADYAAGTRWTAKGLPENLGLRVALHAGPALAIVNPVTDRPGFTGTHLARAARIEPVTPPGLIYCSEAFAAMIALDGRGAYRCEYVGSMPLAKNYGTFPTFQLSAAG
jgi:tetratricopeptide (TPR) repeat protein